MCIYCAKRHSRTRLAIFPPREWRGIKIELRDPGSRLMMGRLSGSQFKFRKNDVVGAAGAEEDAEFLADCYYLSLVDDFGLFFDCPFLICLLAWLSRRNDSIEARQTIHNLMNPLFLPKK
jgi:hypothetical protein